MIKLEVGKFYSFKDKKLFCYQIRYDKYLNSRQYNLEICGTSDFSGEPEVLTIDECSSLLSKFKEWKKTVKKEEEITE